MAPFKAIIIGGSISGLVLAKIFEEYGIDYELLEKHEKIAPQVGAGFAIWPNGARVLDQLGCFEALENANEAVDELTVYDVDGKLRDYRPQFGHWMQSMLGDKMRFMERRHAVQGIWDGLKDKSKVHTSTGLLKVTCDDDGVTAEAANGQVFRGDIIIGADGVHSRVRQEMQRIAAADKPGFDLFPEKEDIECTYSAIFGISKGLDGFSSSEALRTYAKGRSYLMAGGLDGAIYWILQFKNEDDKKTRGKNIPRYTQEDQDRIAAKFTGDHIKGDITFNDLFKTKIHSAIVPLQEGVLKTCHYRRMVLVGDSWHKIHPISGLGGNSAILSAASLSNQLHPFIGKETPSEASIEKAFKDYERQRKGHAKKIVAFAHAMQVSDALENFMSVITKRLLFPFIADTTYMNMFAGMICPSVRLDHLPLPSRARILPFNDEVIIKPNARSGTVSWLWVSLIAGAAWFLSPLQKTNPVDSAWMTPNVLFPSIQNQLKIDTSLYLQLSLTAITSIMCIESYRKSFAVLSLVGMTLPFGIASLFASWTLVLPFYFGLFVLGTATKPFYYPSARALNLAMVQALIPSYLVTYLPPLVCTFVFPTLSTKAWAISHVTLPFVVRLSKAIIERWSSTPVGPEVQYGDLDLEPLTRFLRLLWGVQTIVSLFPRISLVDKAYHAFEQGGFSDFGGVLGELLLLESLVLIFFAFSVWDLRRVHPDNEGFLMQFFRLSVAVLLSPTAALTWFWKDREISWEEARQKNGRT